MAVKKRRRRTHRKTTHAVSNQKSFFHLVMAILALVMVLSMGDNFATSAAGCYGAITQVPPSDNQDKAVEKSQERPIDSPVFRVKENTP